jgi:hypothetical protein
MLLYKNMVLQESGDLPKALAHLEEIEPNVVDRLSLLYTRGARQIVLSPNLTCFSKLTGAGCGQRRSCWAWRGTTRRRSSSSSCWTRTQTITSTTPVCSVPTVVPRRSVSRAALCSLHTPGSPLTQHVARSGAMVGGAHGVAGGAVRLDHGRGPEGLHSSAHRPRPRER